MLQEAIRWEIDPDDYIDEYENCLDETYGQFMNMDASYILKKCDPIGYRCGLNDYVDGYATEKFECPICGDMYDDELAALYCCQDEESDEDEDDETASN